MNLIMELARGMESAYFCGMSNEHSHGHDAEPQQNEIGGPVVFALLLFGLLIIVISFLA
jgi:hypothetical protein|tara:strand:- start:49 stop:225 length:177 start_codon:yes stop_codon:yes gene_type:complete